MLYHSTCSTLILRIADSQQLAVSCDISYIQDDNQQGQLQKLKPQYI